MRRHEAREEGWSIIQPLLPHKSLGVPRVDDRREIDGIPWRFRKGAQWRYRPERFRP
jgi:Transposase and inactivated derivatives